MIEVIADRTVTVRRSTASLLDAVTVAASHSLSRQPSRAARLAVKIAGGAQGTGQVLVSGTFDDGGGGGDLLIFAGNSTLRTARLFTAVSAAGVTTSGLADETPPPTISIQALDEAGSPQNQTTGLASGVPAHLTYPGRGDWPTDRQGSHERDQARVLLPFHAAWRPRVGDVIDEDDTGDRWLIREVRKYPGPLQPVWYEVFASRLQT